MAERVTILHFQRAGVPSRKMEGALRAVLIFLAFYVSPSMQVHLQRGLFFFSSSFFSSLKSCQSTRKVPCWAKLGFLRRLWRPKFWMQMCQRLNLRCSQAFMVSRSRKIWLAEKILWIISLLMPNKRLQMVHYWFGSSDEGNEIVAFWSSCSNCCRPWWSQTRRRWWRTRATGRWKTASWLEWQARLYFCS